jgi:hypothetical protein
VPRSCRLAVVKGMRDCLTMFPGFLITSGGEMPRRHRAKTASVEPVGSRARVFAWAPLQDVVDACVSVAEAHPSHSTITQACVRVRLVCREPS